MPDDYDYQERAAIMEFDGGMSRAEAERSARKIHPLEVRHPLKKRAYVAENVQPVKP